MALKLPDHFATGHITWKSRGYSGPKDEGASGFDVVTAPGALAGLAYSRVFRRVGPVVSPSRGSFPILETATTSRSCGMPSAQWAPDASRME